MTKRVRNRLNVVIVATGLLAGIFLAALRDGRISLVGQSAGASQNAGVVTPVCNPVPPAGADLDGELPGGG